MRKQSRSNSNDLLENLLKEHCEPVKRWVAWRMAWLNESQVETTVLKAMKRFVQKYVNGGSLPPGMNLRVELCSLARDVEKERLGGELNR